MNERRKGALGSSSIGLLIGTWAFEASVEGRPMGRGTATYEWIEDGAFVLQRADDEPSPEADPDWVAHSPMPVSSVIGFDDTTLEHVMLYADARGVSRIYRMTVTETTRGSCGERLPRSTSGSSVRSRTMAGPSWAGGSRHPTAPFGNRTST